MIEYGFPGLVGGIKKTVYLMILIITISTWVLAVVSTGQEKLTIHALMEDPGTLKGKTILSKVKHTNPMS
ncbi:hypothetical protein LYNGBM3L_56780 [Moorena producens 3L]|uniref:Uncharacterized protein n=1 Tax=Moorena producens 3L TaxID=489825 RepID=F4XZA4_9CYAN|nr:hypothetical protein LYNGBM3L_56780 [Moorena producens 3L]OLT64354.1 hypothetical protein BI334_04335 [Moorena producens 3L]